MTAKRIDSLLNPNDDKELGAVVRRARQMEELVSRLRAVLPPEEATSIVAANLRDDGTLVVLASSSAWAARLRFEERTLLEAIGAPAGRCEVRVARGTSDA